MLTDLIKLLPADGSKVTVSWLRQQGYTRSIKDTLADEESYKISYNSPHVSLRSYERTKRKDRELHRPTLVREGRFVRGKSVEAD